MTDEDVGPQWWTGPGRGLELIQDDRFKEICVQDGTKKQQVWVLVS